MRGVYKITNKENGKVYVGETLNIVKRWKEHKWELINGQHHNWKLQQDYNKYGQECFSYAIVSILDDSISNYIDKYALIILEDSYMNYLKRNNIELYNIENTVEKIHSKNKEIFGEDDCKILDNVRRMIENGKMKMIGGNLLILDKHYVLKDIRNELAIPKDEFMELLIKYKLIEYKSSKYVFLNREFINEHDIIKDGGYYKHITVNTDGYMKIIKFVNDHIKWRELGIIK